MELIKETGSITAMTAVQSLGVLRLASRIYDLKRLGYDIRSVTETSKNRYGRSVSYSRYSIPPKGQTEFKL